MSLDPHEKIRAADLTYGDPVSDAVRDDILVFRGIPSWADPRIRPGDLVTTDPDSAWAYAMHRGRLIAARIDTRNLVYYQKTAGREIEMQYVGTVPVGGQIDPGEAGALLGTSAETGRFARHIEKFQKERSLRYVYAKERVPNDAVAVCMYQAPSDQWAETWFYVTPAFPYDPGAWRVSVWDKNGPIGHYGDDVTGKPFMTIHNAVGHVLWEHRRTRIVDYIDGEGAHVRVGPGAPCR